MLQLNHQKPGMVTTVPCLVDPACRESLTTSWPYPKVTARSLRAGFEPRLTLFVMGDRHTSAGSAPLARLGFVGICSSFGLGLYYGAASGEGSRNGSQPYRVDSQKLTRGSSCVLLSVRAPCWKRPQPTRATATPPQKIQGAVGITAPSCCVALGRGHRPSLASCPVPRELRTRPRWR
jgi:hypothetical protein